MEKVRVISIKISEDVYKEMLLRVPEGKEATLSETQYWKNFKKHLNQTKS